MGILITNASEILTMSDGLGIVKDAAVLIEQGKIKAVGKVKRPRRECKIINARGMIVCPGFVDSHTHLVYGGSREDEFAMRVEGLSYEEIAKAGGGIARTVEMTRATSAEELFLLAMERLRRMVQHGTTTVEIKSGYGLSPTEEFKMLRVIKRLKKQSPLDIIPTYLVHTIPRQMKRRDYIDLVTEEIIPEVSKKKLAVFCDIYCDKIAFRKKESMKILVTAREHGLGLKIHADQLSNSGGARLAAALSCTSADHLEYTSRSAIKAMKRAGVVPTLLPGATFYLQHKKIPDIKAYQKIHAPVAIASDYNPGSCMIYSMPKIIALACIVFGMRVEDAIIGATTMGARALDLHHRIGSIEPGKQADIVILNVDNYKKIPYQFGEDIVRYTIKKGRILYGENR
jgi:imidazolonepropionase